MESDFKENYIREQKEQAAARQARLAKIGMSPDDARSSAEPASKRTAQTSGEGTVQRRPTAQSSQRPRPTPVRPVNMQNAQNRANPAQRTVPSAGRSAYDSMAAGTYRIPSAQQGARSASTEAHRRAPAPNAVQTQRNAVGAQQIPQMQGRAPSATPRPAAQRPASDASAQQPAYMNRRPAAQNAQAPQYSQSARNAQGVQTQASQAPRGNAPQRRAALEDTDSHIFKKNLSESESRAMMFALTGEAKNPDNGGDVDVIDMGRTGSIRRTSASRGYTGKKKAGVGTYIGRSFFVLLTAIIMAVVLVYTALLTVAYGPSETVRNLLVNSAMQASATKWVPYLVLSKDKVAAILADSEKVVEDVVSIDDYGDSSADITEDEWANAQDGMIFETVNGTTYKAYVLLVKDPTRVFVGTSTDDFSNATAGVNIFQAADRYGAVACINGGEFLDNGGHGSGYAPLGLTYSKGECVFDDGSKKTFMGFTNENKLIVKEGMTQKEANELGVRDAVSFQTGNTLIERDGDDLKFYYQDGNTGTSQRTAIGQRDDGTVIMIVTDGRTASSLGATHNDMIDLMVSYGAVSAGMLDGGSSAMMFYRDYYDKYEVDKSTLDQYQLQGLVNNYKAFTNPRRIPTFFMVKPEA